MYIEISISFWLPSNSHIVAGAGQAQGGRLLARCPATALIAPSAVLASSITAVGWPVTSFDSCGGLDLVAAEPCFERALPNAHPGCLRMHRPWKAPACPESSARLAAAPGGPAQG